MRDIGSAPPGRVIQLRRFIERRASQHLYCRAIRIPADFPPTVSFTFDDFPQSAVDNGLPILRAAGIAATWYVAAGLLGRPSPVGLITSQAGVTAVHAAGHEIGCHTSSHVRAGNVSARSYRDELEASAMALERMIPGLVLRSFSFPFGSVTAGAKRAAVTRFATCRSAESGIARGRSDLAMLPGNRLYTASVPLRAVEAMVADVRARGGWLIFYTHDVATEPSEWGCTPEYLARVIAAVRQAGLAVHTMAETATLLGWP